MPVTPQQTHLALRIDTHVRHVLAQGDDETLLMSMADYMGTFKQLLDTCRGADMDTLCFSRLGLLNVSYTRSISAL